MNAPPTPRLSLVEQATSRWIERASRRHGVTLAVASALILVGDLLGASVDRRVYVAMALWFVANAMDGRWAAAPREYEVRLRRYAWTLALDVVFLGAVYFFLNAAQFLGLGFFALMVAAASAVLPTRKALPIAAVTIVVFAALVAFDVFGPHVITSPLGLAPTTGNVSYLLVTVLAAAALVLLLLRTHAHVMAALESSESRHQAIVRTAGDMLMIADDSGHLMEVNPAFVEVTGYSWDEVKSVSNSALFAPDEWPEVLDAFRRTLAGGQVDLECRIVCKSGEQRWVEARTSSIAIDGRPAVVVVARDVTERRRVSEQLREQDARLGLVLDALNSGFYTIDTSLVFTSVRGRGSATGAALVGKSVAAIARSPEEALNQRDHHQKAIEGQVVTWVWPVGSGQWVRSHVAPIRNAAGEVTGAAGFWRDETAIMRARDEDDARWSRLREPGGGAP